MFKSDLFSETDVAPFLRVVHLADYSAGWHLDDRAHHVAPAAVATAAAAAAAWKAAAVGATVKVGLRSTNRHDLRALHECNSILQFINFVSAVAISLLPLKYSPHLGFFQNSQNL